MLRFFTLLLFRYRVVFDTDPEKQFGSSWLRRGFHGSFRYRMDIADFGHSRELPHASAVRKKVKLHFAQLVEKLHFLVLFFFYRCTGFGLIAAAIRISGLIGTTTYQTLVGEPLIAPALLTALVLVIASVVALKLPHTHTVFL